MTGPSTAGQHLAPVTDQLTRGLEGFSERWMPQASELDDFLERWLQAWNSHSLDQLEQLVTGDIVWEDPAMLGETVHGRREFGAFSEILFRAMPDVRFDGIGEPYLALGGTGLALVWRMTGTFSGELAFWGGRYGSQPPTWAPTGRRVDLQGVDIYEFRDGLIARWRIVYDLYELMQQLALMPAARNVPRAVLRAQRLIAGVQRRRRAA